MESVRDIYFPGLSIEKKNKADKAKEIIEQELKRGPLKVESMSYKKRR